VKFRFARTILFRPAAWPFLTVRSNFLVLTALAITLASILFLSFFHTPKPYVTITAVSELVSYRVARPSISAIPLVDASLGAAATQCRSPFTGVLEPERGSIIRYRSSGKEVAIQVVASDKVAATLRSDNDTDCQVMGSLTVVVQRNGYIRALPIAGPADIGAEFAAPTVPNTGDGRGFEQARNIMWEGTVQAFTRGWLSGGLSPKADADFKLPAGGRISSGDTLVPAQAGQNVAPWYGIAEITERGFNVSATTTSLDLKLYRPGTNPGDAETFRLDFMANILSDPGMIRLVLIFGMFSYIVSILSQWIGLWRPADDKPAKAGKSR